MPGYIELTPLFAGLLNGLLLRTEVDRVTGQLSDTRTRFLGVRRPKLMAVPVRGKRSMLCLSNRPWLVSLFCTCLAPVASHKFLVPKPDLGSSE